MAAGSVHKVKIAARLRPKLNGELNDDSVKVHHPSDDTGGSSSSTGGASFISVTNPRDQSQVFKFPFTSCYDESSTQEEIFLNDVQPMIDIVFSGITVTIFAYGVTSSGKTHTMQGTKADPGVIPRVVRSMFSKAAELGRYQTSLSVSYMEIYKDDVYDLLVTRESASKLPVRENDVGMVFVANLTTERIASVEEFDALYARATKNRSVGATNLNIASSRSHAVLTIQVTMVDVKENKVFTGKINLVDLAGSENNKLTGNDPSRMAESSAINKSLSVLGQVVHAINQGASRIPYRNSKLTRILQDALGGSSVGLLICNLAPGTKFRQDTLNTLNFAVRTKNIENKPVINERDTRPPPKTHFAVPTQPPAAKLAPALTSTAVGRAGRPSLVPRPRMLALGGSGFQPFVVPTRRAGEKVSVDSDASGSMGIGMSEKDIDERISKAVEAEVTRRLEEREREREKEEEAHRRTGSGSSRHKSKSPKKEKDRELPSGYLTPLLKRHKDLDDELKMRLQELEKKFERGNKEVQLADVLSPVSKKKTGRAYVALARAHSDKGDLQVALDLYRRAEAYVPDNVKLKERIIEIEWAVKNDKAFKPSPKRAKKAKGKKQKKAEVEAEMGMEVDGVGEALPLSNDKLGEYPMSDDQMEVDEVEHSLMGLVAFGTELTNTGSKRSLAALNGADYEGTETPAKRPKKSGKKVVVVESDDEDEFVPAAAPRKSKRKIGAIV